MDTETGTKARAIVVRPLTLVVQPLTLGVQQLTLVVQGGQRKCRRHRQV
jgi:hypothetical protein